MTAMLDVRSIDVYYGDVQALRDVSFCVDAGEIVTLVGSNGAGKSTVLKTVAGLLHPRGGSVMLEGRDVSREPPYRLVDRGLVLIPEARQLWPAMTVAENLEMGAYAARTRELCREGSSRCARSGGVSWRDRGSSCSTSRPSVWRPFSSGKCSPP